jgi:lathosterol oxidase
MLLPNINESSFIEVLAQVSGLFITRSGVAALIGLWIVMKTSFGQERRIYRIPFAKGQMRREFFQILKIVPFYSVLVATAYDFNLIHFSDVSLYGNIFTFLALFVWNEIWFYGLHRWLHESRTMMKIHATHHVARVTSPFSIACFSFAEQTLHVVFALGFPALISRSVPITLNGVVFYSAFQIAVNVLGHMNVEVYPPWFADSTIGQWFTTPTFHGLHHGRSRGHYGLLTTIPDRLFGTFFEDYPRVQARASRGQGLQKFGERADLLPESESAVLPSQKASLRRDRRRAQPYPECQTKS